MIWPLVALAMVVPTSARADLSAYVRARAAAAEGAVDVAAAGYAAALKAVPQDEVVAQRAYRNALAAGDLVLARRAAAVLTRTETAPPDTLLLAYADALRTRNWAAGDATLAHIAKGPLDFMAPILRAWAAFERKGDPFAALDAGRESQLAARYIAEHRALLMIAVGQREAGMDALRTLMAENRASLDLRWNAASMLAGLGERGLAFEVLGGDDPLMASLRRNLVGVKPNAAFGTGRLFTRVSADFGGRGTHALVITLTRATLTLAPGDDRARLLLAEALGGEGAFAQGQVILSQIRAKSPFYDAAQGEKVDLQRKQGDIPGALQLARTLADRSGANETDARRYADILSDQGRDADAGVYYRVALDRASGKGTWVHHLQLGGSLERAGQWDAALPHLNKAVELGADQPIALNYLGYALIDRGEVSDRAIAMLERANRLRPSDAAITDSLGWGYYRAGDVARALPLLEKAAKGDPASVTINEHLGDAYWRAGRRVEARYAWRAASVYADGPALARLKVKQADGIALGARGN